ncbi:hypothetical protein BJ165DRAFT_751271 [Panaeolus papilionaceus]|nr:hypothetical protein BJ165DRAFT_751271 [Panaeolus papilionaceus]
MLLMLLLVGNNALVQLFAHLIPLSVNALHSSLTNPRTSKSTPQCPSQSPFLSLAILLPFPTSTSPLSRDRLLSPIKSTTKNKGTPHARILTSQLQTRLLSLGWLESHLPDGMFYYA